MNPQAREKLSGTLCFGKGFDSATRVVRPCLDQPRDSLIPLPL